MVQPFNVQNFAKSLKEVHNPSEETLAKAEGGETVLNEARFDNLDRMQVVGEIKAITGNGTFPMDKLVQLLNRFSTLQQIAGEEHKDILKWRKDVFKAGRILEKIDKAVQY